ncbi:MAG: aminodeoxychorismate/anthranilate synthase component II [Mariniblastus sp.]|nr:aminodeoxychorismate/anthranilate synthase component II [Mariniblastus sp.]
MILVIDNYDSFVHNLARYFRQLGCKTVVMRNDEVNIEIVKKLSPKAIVISPGPCTPDQAGCSLDLVAEFASRLPMLGICLGHQVMVQALGGSIVQANQPIHGRQSELTHLGSRMFSEIPSPFTVGRYHSLVANTGDLPADLIVTARSDDGTIMAIEHRSWPMVGLQFHPESILTECGYQLLINFLKIANIETKVDFASFKPKWNPVVNSPFSAPLVSDRLSKQEAP